MTGKMRKTVTVLLAAVFAVSTLLLIGHGFSTARGADSYQEAEQLAVRPKETGPEQETLPEATPTEESIPEIPEETEPQTMWVPAAVDEDDHMKKLADINLDALRETNPDVVGWLFVPNTRINYPIVQGEDNQHYLEYTWDNKRSSAGSIFLEATNGADFQDFRSIVYGHNMADSSMFGSLHRYSNKAYWETYPYVYLVTDDGVLRYEIYSSYKASIDSKTYVLNLEGEQMQAAYIQLTIEESELETGISPAATDRILTLSTCVGNASYRRVIHARLPMVEVEIETGSPQETLLQ